MPPPCAWPPVAVSSQCRRESLKVMAEDWQALGLREVEEARQRRRLWAKITLTRTRLAGQASNLVDVHRGMVELVRQAGAELDEVKGQESDE